MATGMLKTDPTLLGRDFKTFGFNSNWTGYEGDDISSGIARTVMNSPELLAKLGLTPADISYTGSASAENDPYGTFKISDAARKALSGLTVSRTGVAGKSDGRSQVIRDAAGNILSTGEAYSYDPAGDLKDAALKGLAVVGAGYGVGSMLGLNGAGAATAAAGTAEGAGAAAAEGAGLSGGAGGAAAGAAEAGAATAAGGGSALNAAAIESLAGTAGYGANAAADLFATAAGAPLSGAGVSAFDSALAAIKNVGLNAVGAVSPGAASALSGGEWLASSIKSLTGVGGTGGGLLSSLLGNSSILGLIGAGVQQYNLEKMADDQRKWVDKKESDARKRRMPTTGPGMLGKFRVIPGGGNGG